MQNSNTCSFLFGVRFKYTNTSGKVTTLCLVYDHVRCALSGMNNIHPVYVYAGYSICGSNSSVPFLCNATGHYIAQQQIHVNRSKGTYGLTIIVT
jgi:hypothetical protein